MSNIILHWFVNCSDFETSNILFDSPATPAGTDFSIHRHLFSTPTCTYLERNNKVYY